MLKLICSACGLFLPFFDVQKRFLYFIIHIFEVWQDVVKRLNADATCGKFSEFVDFGRMKFFCGLCNIFFNNAQFAC